MSEAATEWPYIAYDFSCGARPIAFALQRGLESAPDEKSVAVAVTTARRIVPSSTAATGGLATAKRVETRAVYWAVVRDGPSVMTRCVVGPVRTTAANMAASIAPAISPGLRLQLQIQRYRSTNNH